MALSEEKKKSVIKKIDNFMKKFTDKKGTIKHGIKIGFMGEDHNIGKIEKLPTGIIGFDILTGGGWVKGKINQLWGPPGCGKSTTMLTSIAHSQKHQEDFLGSYLNNEKTLDRDYAEYLGVNLEELLIAEMTTTEESADFVNLLADPDTGVDFVAFDTIQALAPDGELQTSAGKEKSVSDNTMALMPRAWSQFLRMYTSKNLGMTLILGSQVRMDLGGFMASLKETGGNAIKHYNILTVQMTKLSTSTANWPWTISSKADIPPKSFPVKLRIKKAKMMDRYEGNEITIYFYHGKLDHKFNVLAIAKDLGLHDGKILKYHLKNVSLDEAIASNSDWQEEEQEFKAKGFKDMYNRVPDEAVTWLESQLMDTYTKKITLNPQEDDDGEA